MFLFCASVKHLDAPHGLVYFLCSSITYDAVREQMKKTLITGVTGPDGTPRKLFDTAKLTALGWKATTSLHDGLTATYAWFLVQDTIRK